MAHCTCISGTAGNCKHTCALIVYINSERTESQTDQQCQWFKPAEWGKKMYPKGEEVESVYKFPKTEKLTFIGPNEMEQKERLELLRSLGDTSSQMFLMLNAKESVEEEESLEELSDEVLNALGCKDRPYHFCVATSGSHVIKNIKSLISPDLKDFYQQKIQVSSEVAYWICR